MDIGKRIRDLRTRHKISLEKLAKYCGVTKSSVHAWETGLSKNIKLENLQMVAQAFGMSVDELLGDANPETEKKRQTVDTAQRIINHLENLSERELHAVEQLVMALAERQPLVVRKPPKLRRHIRRNVINLGNNQ